MRQLCLNRGSFSHASTGKSAITAGRGDGVRLSPLPPGTPAEVDAMVARETDRWARFVRESGLTLQ